MEIVTWMTSSIPVNKKDVSYHCLIKLEDYEKLYGKVQGKDSKTIRISVDDDFEGFLEAIKDKIGIVIKATFEV